MSDEMRNAAIELAAGGLAVLPLLPRDKQPRRKGSFHNAWINPADIDAHWKRYPNDNIGIRPPAGVVVVDIDPRNEGDLNLSLLEAEHGQLPDTWAAITGSGGLHLWYTIGPGELRGKLCAGVDLKHGGTGFVVAPPSVHPCGEPYVWTTPPTGFPTPAPDWLRTIAVRPPPPPGRHTATSGTGNGPYSAACLVARIGKAAVGERNRTLYGALRDAHRQGDLDTYETDLRAAAARTGLSTNEIDATIRSVRGAN